MNVLALLAEPANYTLDLIERIYRPRGIDYLFMKNSSKASNKTVATPSLNSLPFWTRVRKLFEILKKYDAFIINGYTGITPCCLIWLNILFFKKPMTIESDTELQIPHNRIKRMLKWCWLHFLFTRSYCYGFAGGNYNHKVLFRHYGMKENRIRLAPMVVDNNRYALKMPKIEKKNVFRFGYIGRLVKIKQVHCLIQAIKKLLEDGFSLEGFIIGDGEERGALTKMAEGLPISFTGNLFGEKKVHALHNLDVLILYSSYEPWGLVVNEALASGKPVIVSNRVGAKNDLVVGDNPTGLVAEWDNWKDLAEKMKQLIIDEALYSQLSKNALARISKWDYAFYGSQLDAWIRGIAQ